MPNAASASSLPPASDAADRPAQPQSPGPVDADAYAALQEAYEHARAELDALRGSTGVRLTTGFWAVRDRVLRPGGGPRALYDRSVRPLKRALGVQPPAPSVVQPPPPEEAAPAVAEAKGGDLKSALTRAALAELRAFLSGDAVLDFTPTSAPAVSVILVLYNRAELTFRCLRSLLEQRDVPFELIIVDNASADATGDLLGRIKGATILRNRKNVHFLRGVNQAAAHARGTHLLLLNNDAQVLPGAFRAARELLDGDPSIGAVGGRILLTDGTLQEAGSIIWRDGSCLGYGRGDDPSDSAYVFTRDVDYCSGAFLMTPRATFEGLGGLDEAFAPAYYEETDYCVRLWRSGKRVVYEPRAAIVHFEFASSKSTDAAIRMQQVRQQIFVQRHAAWLESKALPAEENILGARSVIPTDRKRVLFLDDSVPLEQLGSGSPRAASILRALAEAHVITFYPMSFDSDPSAPGFEALPRNAEIMVKGGPERFVAFLGKRLAVLDRIVVSRPHNMQRLRSALEQLGQWPSPVPIVYDAEAIFAIRESQRLKLFGRPESADQEQQRIQAELSLADGAAHVLTVSEAEAAHFRRVGTYRVSTLGHALAPSPTPQSFAQRNGILFAGALNAAETPNSDSLRWFVEEVFPRLQDLLGEAPILRVAGRSPPWELTRLATDRIRILGEVPTLEPLYAQARLFIAPTRFAAGIPYKVHHAAAHGVPIVCTSLLAQQVGWTDGHELRVADDPQAFAEACTAVYRNADLWQSLRERALERISLDCAIDGPSRILREVLA